MYKFVGKKDHMYETDQRLNSNCPESEKQGTGPGSCGGTTGNTSSIKSTSNSGKVSDISEIFPRGVSGGIPTTGKVDISKPYKMIVSGNTYAFKDDLKSKGFTFNPTNKTWEKKITPPDKPSPYGGTVEENQKMTLDSLIASAGKGKGAHRSLKGEIVQAVESPNMLSISSPGTKQINLQTKGGTNVSIKVTGYKNSAIIEMDHIMVGGTRLGGKGAIRINDINGTPTEVLDVGNASITVDTQQIKDAIAMLPDGPTANEIKPDPSLTETERTRFDTFKQTLPGKAMGQETTFAVSGRDLTYDRKAIIKLSNNTDSGEGYRLTLHLNNPYAEDGNEDVYHIDYSAENINQAIKDYSHVVDNKDSPIKNFEVFKRAGYKWPGIKR